MQRVVVLTGAGISAESGIRTFRDSNGLWESYRIEDVATPEAWSKNQDLVLDFYNQRRKQVRSAHPNAAHISLAQLEKNFRVDIITQNIDDLHERAGSTHIWHLHGEILKSRSTRDPRLVYRIEGDELLKGDVCERGSQLRPHIVWFGEEVPMMEKAIDITSKADYLLVIGTSLAVYPAAGLLYYATTECRKYLVDPSAELPNGVTDFKIIRHPASEGVPMVVKELMNNE